MHVYECDPHSGAGNCVCGAQEAHLRHPHMFVRSMTNNCVCTLPPEAQCHLATVAMGLTSWRPE